MKYERGFRGAMGSSVGVCLAAVCSVTIHGCAAQTDVGDDEASKYLWELPSETEAKVDFWAWLRDALLAIGTGAISASSDRSDTGFDRVRLWETTNDTSEALLAANRTKAKRRDPHNNCGIVRVDGGWVEHEGRTTPINSVIVHVLNPTAYDYFGAALQGLAACWYDLLWQKLGPLDTAEFAHDIAIAIATAAKQQSHGAIARHQFLRTIGNYQCKLLPDPRVIDVLLGAPDAERFLADRACDGSAAPVVVYHYQLKVSFARRDGPWQETLKMLKAYTWPPGPSR